MFVFYDTETTGLNRDFDQILQFAAILTDDDLNEVERFDMRCQCLPWVVPAPMALWVTGVSPGMLDDPATPSFYEMMSAIRRTLKRWGPATYVGYNSVRFDETRLQRAFWQTLHPPYLTVMDGNARMDVLPLVQAASHLAEGAFSYPETKTGRTGFKLDQLAPLNGFAHDNAHDALADVEATIHIARILKEKVPDLWAHAVKTAPKQATASMLRLGEPVLVMEYFMNGPSIWWGQRVDRNQGRGTSATLARLSRDWTELQGAEDEVLGKVLGASPKPLRAIAMNKAPLVYSVEAAAKFWDIDLSDEERAMSDFLAGDLSFCDRLLEVQAAGTEPWPEPEHLEQKMLDGFPGREDERLMDAFHKADWEGRAGMVSNFADVRYRQLAQRLIYAERPELLDPADRQRIEASIKERLTVAHGNDDLWRTVPAALQDISEVRGQDSGAGAADEIQSWLEQLVTI